MSDNERMAVLEQRVAHVERQMDYMAEKVDDMHDMMLKAKGATWAVWVLWLAVPGISAAVGWIVGHGRW